MSGFSRSLNQYEPHFVIHSFIHALLAIVVDKAALVLSDIFCE